jgi:ElaB/YqjD/DUF883 family membrane-anchored ribosome-binding protein
MTTNNSHSVEDLRRESERTRAQLVSTVVELREKVGTTAAELKARASPAHIKQEVRTFVREEQRSLLNTVQERIRENPLQAAAVGAMLAYPAWGLLRALPAPLLLIGAGLWLTGSQGRRVLAQAQDKAADLAGNQLASVGETVEVLRERTAELAGQASEQLSALGSAAADRADAAAVQARRMLHDGRDAVTAAARNVRDSVQRTVGIDQPGIDRGGVGEGADLRSRVQAGVDGAIESGRRSLEAASQRALDASRKAGAGAAAFVEENPLLVAGIGLAAGAILGSALPPSETERKVLGKASDLVKAQAGAMAVQAVQRAADTAEEVGKEIKAAAEREGLRGDAIKAPVSAIVGGVRDAAERGLKAAFPDKDAGAKPATPGSE